MPKKDGPISNQMEQLGQRLAQWRNSHALRRRLPEELWTAAVGVAGQEGIYRTARALRLDYANLKRRIEATDAKKAIARSKAQRDHGRVKRRRKVAASVKRGTARTEFVELLAGSIGADCVIEVEGQGGRMRIQMKLTAHRGSEPGSGLAGRAIMIQLTPQMKILVAVEAVDGRKGIDSLVRLCQDTYDNLARLVTSNQTSNGSSAQRRFAYDRWGNREVVWDAVSGGNQIQTIALEQGGGVPTNRIQSVTSPGTLINVALAANGATATASSTYSGSYPETAVIDGDARRRTGATAKGGMMAHRTATRIGYR